MYITQYQLQNALKLMKPQKAVVILGPRRCGKTTLLKELAKGMIEKVLFLNGDDIFTQEALSSQSSEKLRAVVGDSRVLMVDEAQRIPNIGLNIKLIVDTIENIKVVLTGSSSFDLAHNVGEPLTGRKFTLKMYPLAQMELGTFESRPQTAALLEQRLIYGSYPEVVTADGNLSKELLLKEIVNSYLYKDILEFNGVLHSDKISKLLQCLAFQIGKEVSFTELGTQLSMSKNTIERYLDLLEKSFVLFSLKGFSRNLRKEISKNPRYFFYDVGIRNALINNFNSLQMRNDIGMLWENYVVVEMMKKREYLQEQSNCFFWRTYDRKEIDFVVERDGMLFGYEIKWGKAKVSPPREWIEHYGAEYITINKDNYLEHIS